MKDPYISGFTFIKNGLRLGYPIRESIESIAPLCDEVVINVGFDDPGLVKDDGTYAFLRDSFPGEKFRFLKNLWDPEMDQGGQVLSHQTNLALDQCRGKFCQYIQGDEVIHEDDLPSIRSGIRTMEEDASINGLVFDYLHFYGNVDVIKHTRNTYRREMRCLRSGQGIRSWKDAQGFRHAGGDKVACKRIEARIFHYGWARLSAVMDRKIEVMDKLYGGKDREHKTFNYKKIWGLSRFAGTHPRYMGEWVEKHRNDVDILALPHQFEWKDIGLCVSDAIEAVCGYRLGEFKNYKLIK